MTRAFRFGAMTLFWLLPLFAGAQKISFQVPEFQFKNEVPQQQFAKAINDLSEKPSDDFDLGYMLSPDTIWIRDGWNIEELKRVISIMPPFYPALKRNSFVRSRKYFILQ